jgi:very-long-chain enoyl-CoA reductase
MSQQSKLSRVGKSINRSTTINLPTRVCYATAMIGSIAIYTACITRTPNHLSAHQLLAYLLLCIHFTKRAVEIGYIHRYSDGYVPWLTGAGCVVYYWCFALWIGRSLFINQELLKHEPSTVTVVCSVILIVGSMVMNLVAHLRLRNNDRRTTLPQGRLFQLVICPNYTAESCMWWAFFWLVPTTSMLTFVAASTVVLYYYAQERFGQSTIYYDGRAGRDKLSEHVKVFVPWFH